MYQFLTKKSVTMIIGSIVLIVIGLLLTIGFTKIPAGYKGVKVNLMGRGKGAVEEVPTGKYWTLGLINIEYHKFPTFNQNYVWTKSRTEGSPNDESFTFSVDGMPVNIDVGIEYSLQEGKIAELFLKYRKNVDELTDITIRNTVRDSINTLALKYNADALMSGGISQLMDEAEEKSREYFKDDGINIISLSLVNAPVYPANMVEAINNKNQAIQDAVKIENELRQVEAEAQKTIAKARAEYESAKYQAQANRELAVSMSQPLLDKLWIEKWDGKLPITMAGNSSGLLISPK